MRRGTVLHCIPTMAGGGSERQVTYLARELGRLGWAVHVALARRGPNWARLAASGATAHELDAASSYDIRLFGQLQALIKQVKPDIVQTWLLQMEVLGGLSALFSRTPWIFSERSSAAAYPRTIKNFVRRKVGTRASAIVSNSAAGDAYWAGLVGNRVRRFVIPNCIPLEELAAVPAADLAQFGLSPGMPLIVFAGRFEAEKNIEVLLAALEIVLRGRPVQALVCGEGSLRPLVDEWVAAHDFGGRFVVTGYSTGLWGIMKRAAVLVSPSLFEGSPNVVLEAMAASVPLVVSDIPEHREILDDTAALLVDPRSSSSLAQAIDAILQDRVPAAARAEVARARASRYGLQSIAERYTEVYMEVLSARKAL